jgi:DNA-binding regulatory protein, YebC/PmpR family
MSGHSKWSTIKRKKEKTDGARAKIFTKVGREIMVAIKEGTNADPNSNFRLKEVIAKAKANNVPNDNIERLIKKASGDSGTKNFENAIYEGYGPCGVAVIVEALTDNRNRTAGEIRHYFDKFAGNLGAQGCVSFMFNTKGLIVIEAEGLNEEKVMEDALECGASDFEIDEDIFQIYTETADLASVRDQLIEKKYTFISADIEQIPSTYTKIENEELCVKMARLLEMLEENDDVQNVYHNWENVVEL